MVSLFASRHEKSAHFVSRSRKSRTHTQHSISYLDTKKIHFLSRRFDDILERNVHFSTPRHKIVNRCDFILEQSFNVTQRRWRRVVVVGGGDDGAPTSVSFWSSRGGHKQDRHREGSGLGRIAFCWAPWGSCGFRTWCRGVDRTVFSMEMDAALTSPGPNV